MHRNRYSIFFVYNNFFVSGSLPKFVTPAIHQRLMNVTAVHE